jgi:hypothetical protein
MELSRFHAAIEQIADDYKENGIEADLNALVANLASLAANPGNAQVSQAFKDQLNSFRMNLEESSLNDADGELLDTLKNQDLIGHVGNGLFRRIKEVLDENQLTPNLASAGIEKLRVETTKKLSVVTAIDNAFTDLQVEIWRLDEGLTEMLISIPIEEETKTLEDLAKEAKDWHRICDVISETFDIDRNRVTIRTVASGSILLYLAAAPPFIFGVAKCLKGVNQILAEVIKMKGLFKQLVDSKLPEAILRDFEAHNVGKAKTDLEQLASTLVDEYYKGTDIGRKNELKNSLSISLQRLSQKLAVGATVNLRLAVPKKPKIQEGEDATEEQKATLQKIELFEKVQTEVESSKAALDYKDHANELIAALPAPVQDAVEDIPA